MMLGCFLLTQSDVNDQQERSNLLKFLLFMVLISLRNMVSKWIPWEAKMLNYYILGGRPNDTSTFQDMDNSSSCCHALRARGAYKK